MCRGGEPIVVADVELGIETNTDAYLYTGVVSYIINVLLRYPKVYLKTIF